MKKLILVLSLFTFSSTLFAQSPIDKGTLTIGGSISYSSETINDSDVSQNLFLFNPQFGYFLINNLYTALSFTYLHNSSGGYSADQFGIGPAVRYYFDTEKLKPFVGVGFSYFSLSDNQDDFDITNTEVKLTCGVDYFVSRGLAIEGSLNYSFIKYELPSQYYTRNTSVKKFEIGIGVNYFIY